KATNPFIQGLLGIARAADTAVDGITALAAKYSMTINEVTINKQREGLELLNKAEKELLDNAEKQYAAQGKVFKNRSELLSSLKQEYEQQAATGDAAHHTYEVYEKITTTKRALAEETSKLADANVKNEERLEKVVKRINGIEEERAASANNAAKQEIRTSRVRTQLTEEQIAKLREMYREWLEQYLANGDVELASIETRYEKELQKYKDMLRAKVMSYGEYVMAVAELEEKREKDKEREAIKKEIKEYEESQKFIADIRSALDLKTELSQKLLTIRSDFNKAMLESTNEDLVGRYGAQVKAIAEAGFLGSLSVAASYYAGMNELQMMAAQNRLTAIDYETQTELESIASRYESEKATIEATVKDRGERDAALKALDEKRSRDERAVQERADKEKRKIQHETAKQQKIINKTETIIAGAVAAIEAYKAMSGIPVVGPALGAAAASAITALTYEKVRLIEEQPLPPLARGALIQRTQGGTPVIVGEGRHDEAVIPLNAATFDMLGERMVAALMSRAVNHSVTNTVTNIDNRATVEHPREPIHIHNVIELDGEVISEFVTKATDDARILINPRAIK
ncbi:MAG TPA: hypothetical protein PL088_15155, partial [Spirochaetota bacterium]|nr:hypothetical protein [Spirochaetota bacterium]